MCCKKDCVRDDCGIAKAEPHWRTQRDHLYYRMVTFIKHLKEEDDEFYDLYDIFVDDLLKQHEHIELIIHTGKDYA